MLEDATVGLEEQSLPPLPVKEGGLEGYLLSASDYKMWIIYSDHVHQNDGAHLTGGVKYDQKWQNWWKSVVALPDRRLSTPRGRIVKIFIGVSTEELKGILKQKWNSEHFLLFQSRSSQMWLDLVDFRHFKHDLQVSAYRKNTFLRPILLENNFASHQTQ